MPLKFRCAEGSSLSDLLCRCRQPLLAAGIMAPEVAGVGHSRNSALIHADGPLWRAALMFPLSILPPIGIAERVLRQEAIHFPGLFNAALQRAMAGSRWRSETTYCALKPTSWSQRDPTYCQLYCRAMNETHARPCDE